jgi:hypothetical protein
MIRVGHPGSGLIFSAFRIQGSKDTGSQIRIRYTGFFVRLLPVPNLYYLSYLFPLGIWVWKGQNLAFELSEDWQIDYASYE